MGPFLLSFSFLLFSPTQSGFVFFFLLSLDGPVLALFFSSYLLFFSLLFLLGWARLYPLSPLLLVLGFGGFLGLSSPPSFVAVQFDIVGPGWASPLLHHLWLLGMALLGLVWASSLIHWLLFGFYPCRYLSKHK
jgi:hypothetical protein